MRRSRKQKAAAAQVKRQLRRLAACYRRAGREADIPSGRAAVLRLAERHGARRVVDILVEDYRRWRSPARWPKRGRGVPRQEPEVTDWLRAQREFVLAAGLPIRLLIVGGAP